MARNICLKSSALTSLAKESAFWHCILPSFDTCKPGQDISSLISIMDRVHRCHFQSAQLTFVSPSTILLTAGPNWSSILSKVTCSVSSTVSCKRPATIVSQSISCIRPVKWRWLMDQLFQISCSTHKAVCRSDQLLMCKFYVQRTSMPWQELKLQRPHILEILHRNSKNHALSFNQTDKQVQLLKWRILASSPKMRATSRGCMM